MAETLRRPRRKSYSDDALASDLVDGIHRYSEKNYPFLVGTIVWVLELFTKGLAFNIKAITRKNLGSRTFGVFLLMDAYFMQKLFLFMILLWMDGSFQLSLILDLFDSNSFVGQGFNHSFYWWPNIEEFLKELNRVNLLKFAKYFLAQILPQLFGYIFLWNAIKQMFRKTKKSLLATKENSYGHGESRYFKDLKGKKIGKITITDDIICMVFEPLLVLVVGFALWKIADSPLGIFLMISAGAVFYEEYKPYWRRREKIQDKIDAEYEMEKIKAGLKTYEEGIKRNSSSGSIQTAPVTFANGSDLDRYRSEMKKHAPSAEAVRTS